MTVKNLSFRHEIDEARQVTILLLKDIGIGDKWVLTQLFGKKVVQQEKQKQKKLLNKMQKDAAMQELVDYLKERTKKMKLTDRQAGRTSAQIIPETHPQIIGYILPSAESK